MIPEWYFALLFGALFLALLIGAAALIGGVALWDQYQRRRR